MMSSTTGETIWELSGWASVRESVIQRDDEQCVFCGMSREAHYEQSPMGRDLEVHHIVPRRVNGPDIPQNLITVCAECHTVLGRITRKLVDGPSQAADAVHHRSVDDEDDPRKLLFRFWSRNRNRKDLQQLAREHARLREQVALLRELLVENGVEFPDNAIEDTTPTEQLIWWRLAEKHTRGGGTNDAT